MGIHWLWYISFLLVRYGWLLGFPCCTVKVRWERNFLMNVAMFPLIPVLWRSFRIPYLHVVTYAFSRSKKIETTWLFLIRPLRVYILSLVSWSLVPWFHQNPLWYLDKMLCFSRYQISHELTILSIVLQLQLVKAMGW